MSKQTRIDNAAARAYARSFAAMKANEPFGKDCHGCGEPLSVGEVLLGRCSTCGAAPSKDPDGADDDLPF